MTEDFLYSLPKNCSHCIITGITHNLKVLAPVRHYHDGAITNMDLISLNADLHAPSNSKIASFSSSLHNGFELFEKSLMNLL